MDNLFVLFTVIFVVLNKIEFTEQSLDERFLCTEKYCQNYVDEHGCPGVDLACMVQNSTHHGRLFPSPTPCNCCEFCLKHQEQGKWCTIGTPGSPLPNEMCGPGLYCTPHDGTHPTCEPMYKSSKCFKAQSDFDDEKQKGLKGDLAPRPKCNGDGFFEPIVCVPGQTCFCVDEDGERIFGEAVETDDIEFRMKCECSRLAYKARELIDEKYPVLTARCDSMGSFDTLQCMNGTCFCANPTGSLMSNEVANITEGLRKLPCGNRMPFRNWTSMEHYLRPCEKKLMQQIELKFSAEDEGIHVVDFKLEDCTLDGWYPPVRENKTTKYCSDEKGDIIENYAISKKEAEAENMNCKCARTRKLLIEAKALEIPKCVPLGNFLKYNCRRGMCYCIDENGLQTSSEVRSHEICGLWCCQNGKCGCKNN